MKQIKESFLLIWPILWRIALFVLSAVFAILLIRVIAITILVHEKGDPKSLGLNGYGDFVGGVWGTILSVFTLVATIIGSTFIYRTFLLQERQIEIQNRQFNSQKGAEYFQNVSNIVYNQLQLLNNRIEKFKHNGKSGYSAMKLFSEVDLSKISVITPVGIDFYNLYHESWDLIELIFDSFNIFTGVVERDHSILEEFERRVFYTIVCTSLNMTVILKFLEQSNNILKNTGETSSPLSLTEENRLYEDSLKRLRIVLLNTNVTASKALTDLERTVGRYPPPSEMIKK